MSKPALSVKQQIELNKIIEAEKLAERKLSTQARGTQSSPKSTPNNVLLPSNTLLDAIQDLIAKCGVFAKPSVGLNGTQFIKDITGKFDISAYIIPALAEDTLARDNIRYYLSKNGNIENRRLCLILPGPNGQPIALLFSFEEPNEEACFEIALPKKISESNFSEDNIVIDEILSNTKESSRYKKIYNRLEVVYVGSQENFESFTSTLERAFKFAFKQKFVIKGKLFLSGTKPETYTIQMVESISGLLKYGSTDNKILKTYAAKKFSQFQQSKELIHKSISEMIAVCIRCRNIMRGLDPNRVEDVDALFLFQMFHAGNMTPENHDSEKLLSWLQVYQREAIDEIMQQYSFEMQRFEMHPEAVYQEIYKIVHLLFISRALNHKLRQEKALELAQIKLKEKEVSISNPLKTSSLDSKEAFETQTIANARPIPTEHTQAMQLELNDILQFLVLKNDPTLLLKWASDLQENERVALLSHFSEFDRNVDLQAQRGDSVYKEISMMLKRSLENRILNQYLIKNKSIPKVFEKKEYYENLDTGYMVNTLRLKGNPKELIEWLANARHIEEQSLAGHFTAVLHIFEKNNNELFEALKKILICLYKYDQLTKARKEIERLYQTQASDLGDIGLRMLQKLDENITVKIFKSTNEKNSFNLNFLSSEFIYKFLSLHHKPKELLNWLETYQLEEECNKIYAWINNIKRQIKSGEKNWFRRTKKWLYEHSLMRLGVEIASISKPLISYVANTQSANRAKALIQRAAKWSVKHLMFHDWFLAEDFCEDLPEQVHEVVGHVLSEKTAHKTLEIIGFAGGSYLTYIGGAYSTISGAILSMGLQSYTLGRIAVVDAITTSATDYCNKVKIDYKNAIVIHEPKFRQETTLWYPAVSFTLACVESYFTGRPQTLISAGVGLITTFSINELSRYLPGLRSTPEAPLTEFENRCRYLFSVLSYQLSSQCSNFLMQQVANKISARNAFMENMQSLATDDKAIFDWIIPLDEERQFRYRPYEMANETPNADVEPIRVYFETPDFINSPTLLFTSSDYNPVIVKIEKLSRFYTLCDVGIQGSVPSCNPLTSTIPQI